MWGTRRLRLARCSRRDRPAVRCCLDAGAGSSGAGLLLVVRGSSGPRIERPRETAGFVEEQRSPPALPLLVRRKRVRHLSGDARSSREGAATFQARAAWRRVLRFDDWDTLRPCVITAYVDMQQCRRSSRCRPSARFAALVGSPEVTPSALRHHPGRRPRARVAIFAQVRSSSRASFVAPRRSCAHRARIGAPREIRSVGDPHADRRPLGGL